jgi:nucleotide-binding universal stress UspA family protein
MKTQRTIECAVTDDGRGARLVGIARALAEMTGWRPQFVHAAAVRAELGTPWTAGQIRRLEGEALQRARAVLLGLDVSPHDARVLVGDPRALIVDSLRRDQAAICLVASRGLGPLRAALQGSVSRALVRRAPCPVGIVPPGADGRLAAGGPLICGVDPSTQTSDMALEFAGRLALISRRPLVLAHASRTVPLALAAAPHGEASFAVNVRFPDAMPRQGRGILQAARALVPRGVPVSLELLNGEPAAELSRLARVRQAAAVIVGTRGDAALPAALTGSTQMGLTQRAPCLVIVTGPGMTGAQPVSAAPDRPPLEPPALWATPPRLA